jgi:hypothetical protein
MIFSFVIHGEERIHGRWNANEDALDLASRPDEADISRRVEQ